MVREPVRILLTGPPGCGKTTAVLKIVGMLQGQRRMAGFYTEEIRAAGRRQGFRWHRLDGRTGVLAHVDIKGPCRVSRYGVDLDSFEGEAVAVLNPEAADVNLFVVDEIGKMECSSQPFVHAVRRLLHAEKSLLATVAQKGAGLIREVKSCPGVQLLHLSTSNRNRVTQQVAHLLAAESEGG
jgi:nucleoside-triphosphatase